MHGKSWIFCFEVFPRGFPLTEKVRFSSGFFPWRSGPLPPKFFFLRAPSSVCIAVGFLCELCEFYVSLKKDVACTAGLNAEAVSGCMRMCKGVVCM